MRTPTVYSVRHGIAYMRDTVFKAYFIVFESTDVKSIQTRFSTELRHASFLIKTSTFVAICVSVTRVTSTGIHPPKAWHAIIYSHAQRFFDHVPNESVDSVKRRGTDVQPTEAWFVPTRSDVGAFITETL